MYATIGVVKGEGEGNVVVKGRDGGKAKDRNGEEQRAEAGES